MQKRTRKFLVSSLIACMSFTNIYASSMDLFYDGKHHTYELPPITLYVNGEQVETQVMPPIQIDGRVLVPAREVFAPLGADVEWKSYERKIYVHYNDTVLILEPDNDEVWMNGETVKLDVPAKIINDKIMVPLRFIGESIDLGVEWVGETRSVKITEKESAVKPNPEPMPEPEPELPWVPNPIPVYTGYPGLESVLAGIEKIVQEDTVPLMVDTYTGQYAMTTVDRVSVLPGSRETTAMIETSTPLSGIKVLKGEGKVVVDILNSKSKLPSVIQVPTNNFIKQVRTSQYTADQTRVVFDLKSGADAYVTIGSDRKSIFVELTKETLSGVAVGEDFKGEYVALEGVAPSQIQVKEDVSNLTMTLTIPNMNMKEEVDFSRLRGDFVEAVYAQNKGSDLEMVIELNRDCTYNLEPLGGHTLVRFTRPIFEFIKYDNANGNRLLITMPEDFNLNDIKLQDQYRNKQMVIDLGKDYSDTFSEGQMSIEDQVVKAISVKNNGTTKITIDESKIHAAQLRQEGNTLIVEMVRPKEMYDKILVIDAGHGGRDAGVAANGVKEKEINMRQTQAIVSYIEANSDIKVYWTRESDVYPTLTDRTDLANEIEADMFISVHNNSFQPTTKGTEIFYYPSPSDNRSKRMAEIALRNILDQCGTFNRGVKSGEKLAVLRTSKMPAILLEGAFISNPTEAAMLNTEAFTQKYGVAVGSAVIEMFETLTFR